MKTIGLGVAVLLFLVLIAGGVVMNGILLGILTTVGFVFLALKNKTIRWFARRFPFLADIIGSVGAFFMFPQGVTAFVGAATVGILMTVLIALDIELAKLKKARAEVLA